MTLNVHFNFSSGAPELVMSVASTNSLKSMLPLPSRSKIRKRWSTMTVGSSVGSIWPYIACMSFFFRTPDGHSSRNLLYHSLQLRKYNNNSVLRFGSISALLFAISLPQTYRLSLHCSCHRPLKSACAPRMYIVLYINNDKIMTWSGYNSIGESERKRKSTVMLNISVMIVTMQSEHFQSSWSCCRASARLSLVRHKVTLKTLVQYKAIAAIQL